MVFLCGSSGAVLMMSMRRYSYHSEILLRHLIYPCYSRRGTEIALLDIHRVVGIIKWNGGWGGGEPREDQEARKE
jgi:hypothetical protein